MSSAPLWPNERRSRSGSKKRWTVNKRDCRGWGSYVEEENDRKESFVSWIQNYTDKSQVNLNPTSFTLYPLLVTILFFTEVAKRKQITWPRYVVAYLNFDFVPTLALNSSYGNTKYEMCFHRNARSIMRDENFKLLQKLVGNCMSMKVDIEEKNAELDETMNVKGAPFDK